jgi:hypothetical protein
VGYYRREPSHYNDFVTTFRRYRAGCVGRWWACHRGRSAARSGKRPGRPALRRCRVLRPSGLAEIGERDAEELRRLIERMCLKAELPLSDFGTRRASRKTHEPLESRLQATISSESAQDGHQLKRVLRTVRAGSRRPSLTASACAPITSCRPCRPCRLAFLRRPMPSPAPRPRQPRW